MLTEALRPVRLAVDVPSTDLVVAGTSSGIALSPDGASLVYVGSRDGVIQLFRRSFDQFGVTPIPNTENGRAPFFSADGGWIGFVMDGTLKKISVDGGPPVTLCECAAFGASWKSDRIVLGGFDAGLAWVPDDGGIPELLTTPDPARGERSHRWPDVLPGGHAVSFTVVTESLADASVAVLSLETKQWNVLIEHGQQAQYVPTGHIVYARGDDLFAAAFDPARLEVTGSPVPVVEGIFARPPFNFAQFSVSDAGTLVYAPASADVVRERRFVWVNRQGGEELLPITPGSYQVPRLSPDGQRVAVTVGDTVGDRDIWIFDVSGTPPMPLTSAAENAHPVWTPDGNQVVFDSTTGGSQALVWLPADGSVYQPELLLAPEVMGGGVLPLPLFWTPDGQELVFSMISRRSIWALPRDGEQPRPLVSSRFYVGLASVSPNGRWLAYVSDRTGEREVWVQSYGDSTAPKRVSDGGGLWPTWAPNGRELYYLDRNRMMAVEFAENGSDFKLGQPERLFDEPYFHPATGPRNYDVGPDGRFLMLKGRGRDEIREYHVVLHWTEELRVGVPGL